MIDFKNLSFLLFCLFLTTPSNGKSPKMNHSQIINQ